MATEPKVKVDKSQDFGDNTVPTVTPPNPEAKQFKVFLKDGTQTYIDAFRLFTSYDANLGLVVRALRSDDTEVGVFYEPQGWALINPTQWAVAP